MVVKQTIGKVTGRTHSYRASPPQRHFELQRIGAICLIGARIRENEGAIAIHEPPSRRILTSCWRPPWATEGRHDCRAMKARHFRTCGGGMRVQQISFWKSFASAAVLVVGRPRPPFRRPRRRATRLQANAPLLVPRYFSALVSEPQAFHLVGRSRVLRLWADRTGSSRSSPKRSHRPVRKKRPGRWKGIGS